MTKLWVDPPEGWRYGFPKVWDTDVTPTVREWLLDNGYQPEQDIDLMVPWVTLWPVEESNEST